MWELDCEESWAPKTLCFWTVVLEKTLESPLNCKEIQPVHSKGDQSWVFIGRTDAKAETPVLWPPHAKSWLIGKDPDAGRDLGQEERGMTEDEMAGWHHRLNGHEFEWTPGVGDGQGGLACCDSWVAKSQTWLSDWTELNWSEGGLWRRAWQPTPVVLPRESHGQSLAGYSQWGRKSPDTTEQLNHRYRGDLSSFPLRRADYMLLPLNKASLSAQLSCGRSRSWPARTGQVPSRSGGEQDLLALPYLPQLCFAVWYWLKVCLPPTEPHQSVGSREPGFVFVFPTTVLPTTTVLRIQSELTEVMNTLNHWKHFLKTSPHFPHPALKKESQSEVVQLCPTLCEPMASLSMGFSRQEYWNGLPFPPRPTTAKFTWTGLLTCL